MNAEITPLQRASSAIESLTGCTTYFKREDLSPTGSFKHRPLLYQLTEANKRGFRAVVVPTSGNAGITAAMLAPKFDIVPYIFTDRNIEQAKFETIRKEGGIIFSGYHSLKQANLMSARQHIPNLRPSVNDDAIIGYMTLGEEIARQCPQCEAVFSFTTSGASLLGYARYYDEKGISLPDIHAVQSGSSNSISGAFASETSVEHEPLAGRGGVKNTRRKDEVIELIQRSGGSAWHISNHEICAAEKLLQNDGIETSYEGCASLAAALRACKERTYDTIVIILSGKMWK